MSDLERIHSRSGITTFGGNLLHVYPHQIPLARHNIQDFAYICNPRADKQNPDEERTRASPTPYLFPSSPPALSRSFSPGSENSVIGSGHIAIGLNNNNNDRQALLTPPGSVGDYGVSAGVGSLGSSPGGIGMSGTWSNDRVVPKPLLLFLLHDGGFQLKALSDALGGGRWHIRRARLL